MMKHALDLILTPIPHVLHPRQRPRALPLHHPAIPPVELPRRCLVVVHLRQHATFAVLAEPRAFFVRWPRLGVLEEGWSAHGLAVMAVWG